MRAPVGPGQGRLRLFLGRVMKKGVRPLFWVACLITLSDCGPTVDLATGLQVQDVSTGWFDAGIVNGQNKLVPSISFALKNTSDQTLVSLQVNALFRRATEKDEWGTGFLTAAGSAGLPPGAVTPRLIIRSPRGYTGSGESREEMLRNSHFVDALVELSAKYGSAQWTRIGEYPIARQLITK
jgi:hypothetical protein